MDPAPIPTQRRASSIGNPPSNPADRKVITLAPPPSDTDFLDPGITRVIGHNCLIGWPTATLTWAETSPEFKKLAWDDFTSRYTWDPSIDEKVKMLYAEKCAIRTRGNIFNARNQAKAKAEKQNPGHGREFMHEFPPWWCVPTIWTEMCQKRNDEKWVKKEYSCICK